MIQKILFKAASALILISAVWMPCVMAGGLFVYVDQQGVPHYALQKLDERYQLFVNDDISLSDDVNVVRSDDSMQAKLPNMEQYIRAADKKNKTRAKRTLTTTQGGMVLPNGLHIAAPSKAVLNRLLRSQALARYEPIIHKHARKSGVDVNLVKAVMAAESGFNANAISPKNAQGLMQVIPPTAARYGVTEAQLMNPERNIYAGVRYLADLSRMFKGRPELIIAAYNAGEGAVYKYKRQIPPYKETQNYVRTVLQFYTVYNPNGRVNMGSQLARTDMMEKPAAGISSRRTAQRVSMKVGGRLKTPVVLE